MPTETEAPRIEAEPADGRDPSLAAVFELQREHAAFLKRQPAEYRLRRVRALRDSLLRHRDAVQEAMYADFRKAPESVDGTEILPVALEAAHTVRNLRRWMKPRRVPTPLYLAGTSAVVRPEPRGTALIMAPWNYPVLLTVGPLVSAVAAGCPAIVKPSELTPATSSVVRDLVSAALPPEEALVVEGGVETAERLLALPFDHIYFTGSARVGQIVLRAAAEHLSSVTLELGGKSPSIVDESADLAHAARVIAFSKFSNCGQTCLAPDHVYVHEGVYDRFVAELASRIDKIFGADAEARMNAPGYGALINERHGDRIRALVAEAIDGGALLHAGDPQASRGRLADAVVLGRVPSGARLMDEEIFGPVLPLVRFRSLDEVARDIRARPKPLALYVFSNRTRTVEQLCRATSAGATVVNDALIHFLNFDLPFGGVGGSGLGKGKGEAGFRAFSNERAVLRQHVRPGPITLLYPPFTAWTRRIIDWLLRLY
jgi:aldehyde dehydrogenase (NAD+)